MDNQKKEEIQKKIRKQKYILASVQAKIAKLEAQLENEIVSKPRNKVKTLKNDEKTIENNAKALKNNEKTEKSEEKESSFLGIF